MISLDAKTQSKRCLNNVMSKPCLNPKYLHVLGKNNMHGFYFWIPKQKSSGLTWISTDFSSNFPRKICGCTYKFNGLVGNHSTLAIGMRQQNKDLYYQFRQANGPWKTNRRNVTKPSNVPMKPEHAEHISPQHKKNAVVNSRRGGQAINI